MLVAVELSLTPPKTFTFLTRQFLRSAAIVALIFYWDIMIVPPLKDSHPFLELGCKVDSTASHPHEDDFEFPFGAHGTLSDLVFWDWVHAG